MQKILVVDDEAPVRESIVAILGRCGYRMETAESGPKALAMCRVTKYDLVLTDLKMPGMSGQELAKHLKSINSDLRIVLVTAVPQDAPALFEAVIQKPFSLRELRDKVSAALPVPAAIAVASKPDDRIRDLH